jgi:MFS transporter, OFA family, oxalate/formate antiporter
LKQRSSFYYGWVIMIASLIIGIISFGIRYSFGVFFNSLETEFHLTRTAVSSIFSIYMVLCGIFGVAGGWALDRFGPRKVATAMCLITGASLLISSRVQAAWQLYFTYSFLLAIGTGALFSIVNTTTTRWFLRKRGLAVGITSAAGSIGEVILAPLTTYLIAHFDWRTSFLILGVMVWVVLIPVSQLMKRDPRDVGLLPDGTEASTGHGKKVIHGRADDEGLTLSQAWKVREFWYLILTWLLLSFSVHLVLTHAVPHATDLGISALNAALIISLVGAGSIVGRLIEGRLSDTLGRKPLALSSAALMVLALISLIFIKDLWMFLLFGVVFGYAWGGLGSQVTLLIGDVFGVRSLGIIMGTITAGWALGAAIGPAVGGWVFDTTRTYSAAFALAAGGMVVCTLLAFLIRPGKAKSS